MVLFYSITVNEYQNTCKSKREKKKNYSPLVAIAFSTNGASYKKNIKQFSIKRNTMYNVMLLFFSKKKLNIPERIHRTAHARLPVNSVGRV